MTSAVNPPHKNKNKTTEWDVPFTEVFDAFRGEYIVIPLPRELCLDEALGSQALHGLDNLQIRYFDFFMFRRVIILLGNKDTLCRIAHTVSQLESCVPSRLWETHL